MGAWDSPTRSTRSSESAENVAAAGSASGATVPCERKLVREQGAPDYPRRLLGIDVLRALAAVAVVVRHVTQGVDDKFVDTNGALADPGGWGVGLFFVVSGFCIHSPLVRRELDGVDVPLDLRAFFKRRFLRLYPTHLIALATSILLAALWPWTYPAGHSQLSVTTPLQLGAHLVMIHSFFEGAVFSGNMVLWTLAVETHFYLLYPLLLRLRRTVPLGWIVLAAWASGEILKLVHPSLILQLNFPCRWWEWLLGALVAEEVLRRRPRVQLGLFAFIAAVAAGFPPLSVVERLPHGLRIEATLRPLCCALFVGLAVWMRPSAGFVARALARVGEESYSLYLAHGFAIHLAVPWLAGWGLSTSTMDLATCLAVVPVTHVFFLVAERPFLRAATRVPQPVASPATG